MVKKHERDRSVSEQYKDRFRKMSSEKIWYILATGYVQKAAEIAYREVLEERGETHGDKRLAP